MIVKCPNCATKYNLPDDRIREGATLKCTVCEHLFPLSLEEPEPMKDRFSLDDEEDIFSGMEVEGGEEEVAGETDTQDFTSDVDEMSLDETVGQEFGDDPFSGDEAPAAAFSVSEESTVTADDLLGNNAGGLGDAFFDSQPDPAPSAAVDSFPQGISPADDSLNDDFLQDLGGSGESVSFNLDDMAGTGSRRRRPGRAVVRKEKSKAPAVILMLLALIGIGGGVAYYLYPDLVAQYLPFLASGENTDAGAQGNATDTAIDKEAVRNIGLENVRQYYMDNDKLGPVCIIDGSVVNNFSTPKELIAIRASLLGPAGEVLVEKTQKCGVTLTQFELSVFSEEQIEEALNANVSILMANTNVQPGDTVDFMIVFANPPENVSEYVVKVVDAQDPPEKEPEE